jgi:hypothetical protein
LITHSTTATDITDRIYSGPNWEPEITFAQVTCNSVASGGCNDRYIDLIPAGYDMNGNPISWSAIGQLGFTSQSIPRSMKATTIFAFTFTSPGLSA